MDPLPDATAASALAIAEAYAIDADPEHELACPPGYGYSGIAWTGAGHGGNPRTFGLGFQREGTLLLAFRGTAEVADLLADLHWREAPFRDRADGTQRAVTLMGKASPEVSADISAALKRLTDSGRGGMGSMFKVLAVTEPNITAVAGLSDEPPAPGDQKA